MGWRKMSTAPRDGRDVRLLTAGGFELLARFTHYGFIDARGNDVGSWVASIEDKHPECWTDGAYWKSNENEMESDPPIGWLPTPKEAPDV